ncbi:MAG: hypothetical protein WD875_01015 [Pirellulales bacterium]
MPRLHETTRRMICRIAFLALCVAPTVAVLAWAASANSSNRATEAEAELAAVLELAVSVDDVAYPRPGVAVYTGVVLSDGETRRVVAEIERLERMQTSEGTTLVVPHAEVDAAQLDRLWNVVDRLLRVGRATQRAPLRLSIERLTLHGDDAGDSITLSRVGGQLVCDDEASRAGLRFSLPENQSSEPVQLVVRRSRDVDPLATRLELRTGGAPLPLAAARGVFPALKHLGDRAEFTGQLWASHSGGESWSGELAGRLRRVDMDALVARQFPHKLSGEAEITLQRLAFADGRLSRLVGRFEAGPGVVGRTLIDAAVDALGMRAANGTKNTSTDGGGDFLKYERLAMTFDVDGEHAAIAGACPSTAAEANASDTGALCVIRDAFGPLLFGAERQPQPALGLVRLLVPPSDLHVPATRETDWLLQRMPMPSAKGPATSSATSSAPGDEPARASLRDATAVETSAVETPAAEAAKD